MVGTQIPKELIEETYRAIEAARTTGKITKGSNETTKSLERGTAKLVAVAKDVEPAEIVMHLPALAKEKGIICVEVPSKTELGAAAGLGVKATCVSIVKEGEAKRILSKLVDQIKKLSSELEKPKVEEKEVKEETKAEKKQE